MSLFSVFLIGIGLSMDACAVSFAKGICLRRQVKTYALKLGLAFGLFLAWFYRSQYDPGIKRSGSRM